ncbi:hypothetical protein [Mesobacterium pallidum]|uniref:hypothetical protein n=1 Tax=Mesobacterium pallidum TaxID=2872037 RepID=UPI001EE2827C|nr:hypothetical protein [Mesobacterium pallidum]
MTEFDRDGDALEPFFKAVRAAEVPAPGPDMLARVLAAAEAELDARAAPVRRPGRPGFFATFLRAIGGWPAMGGLAAATFAGVMIGVVQPASLVDQVSPWLMQLGLASEAEDAFSLDPDAGLALTFAAIEG